MKAGLVSASFVPMSQKALQTAEPSQPSANWGLGILRGWQNAPDDSRSYLLKFTYRSPRRLRLLRALYPNDRQLACTVRESYPHISLAVFWCAETMAKRDALTAISLYETGLAQESWNAVRWVELGHLYRQNGQLQNALTAFGQGCRWRDRGGNGCWQAGHVAEDLEQIDLALDYYHRTLQQIPNWSPALARIEALNQQNPQSNRP